MIRRIVKVEFGESTDGVAAPASFTEIPELVPFELSEDEVQQAELADGTQVQVDVRKQIEAASYDLTNAVWGTLRTYALDPANSRIWVKLTDLQGNVLRIQNMRVAAVVETGGQPPRIVVRFQKTTADGAFYDTAGTW